MWSNLSGQLWHFAFLLQFGPEFRYVPGKTHNTPYGHKKGAAYNNAGDEFGTQQAAYLQVSTFQ